MKGFSLLEVLIVIAIMSIITSLSSGFYMNYNNNLQIESIAKDIKSDLKLTQSYSMSGINNLKWGIHFVNGGSDYYELFSTPTDYNDVLKTITTTKYLQNNILFNDPAPTFSKDIIFNKITGSTVSSSLSIYLNDNIKNIVISSNGSAVIQ